MVAEDLLLRRLLHPVEERLLNHCRGHLAGQRHRTYVDHPAARELLALLVRLRQVLLHLWELAEEDGDLREAQLLVVEVVEGARLLLAVGVADQGAEGKPGIRSN